MAKSDFGLEEDELYRLKQFGLKYINGLGFSLEQITIFYLYVEYGKDTVEMGNFLNRRREIIRRILVQILRKLRKYMFLYEKEEQEKQHV